MTALVPRSTLLGAPTLTLIMLAATGYLLLGEDGWRSTPRWVLFSCVCLLFAVALSHSAALVRRGLPEAAIVLLWSMFVASAFFVMFATLG